MMISCSAGEPVVYATEGPWERIYPALAEGSGARIVPTSAGLQDGVALVWGLLRGSPEIIEQALAAGKPWIYLDHGYFRRGHYDGHYRMTWGDFQQSRVYPSTGERWRKLALYMRGWRSKGKGIVVCPPSDHVAKLFGAQDWLKATLETLKAHTDRPIIVRRKDDPLPLRLALEGIHALVTMNSIAAVEAVTLGCPVFVSPKSAAAPVGETDLARIEKPSFPARDRWAWSLADGQYTIDEMRNGTAWRLMSERC